MLPLTNAEQIIHNQALSSGRKYLGAEFALIDDLRKVEGTRLYKKLDKRSLFAYAVEILGLSEAISYALISIMRKTKSVPELQEAIATQGLKVSKAARIVSALNPDNAKSLIAFAKAHTSREIDLEVARLNPTAAPMDRVKPINHKQILITIAVPMETYAKLTRAESLEAQKGRTGHRAETLDAVLEVYLDHQDPVRKAQRLVNKPPKLCPSRVTTRRQPLTAAEKHAVFRRDCGRCTYLDPKGQRCNSDRWIDVHHILQVSRGGGNDPTNLATLCRFHHDLTHLHSGPLASRATSPP